MKGNCPYCASENCTLTMADFFPSKTKKMRKIEPKFLIRSDENYYEYGLSYCGILIKGFKKSYFRKNSKSPARIYAKVFFPIDCPEHFWIHYLVFEVNGKPYQVTSITKEAFDTLTRDIEPNCFASIEFYTIEKHPA